MMKYTRFILYILAALAVFLSSVLVTITLLIRDSDSVNCPNTVGKDLQEARRIAERNGLFVLVVRYQNRKDVPYNEIIAQRPEPNMSVRRGRTISVVVSEGPIPVTIPDLINQPLEGALNMLQEKAIKVKQVIYVPGSKEGSVVAQSPGTGSQLLDEEGMVLFVGVKTRAYYVMPDVIGINYTGLVEELDKKQLEYRIGFTQRPALAPKIILDASIPAGTVFDSDQTIYITVNLGG